MDRCRGLTLVELVMVLVVVTLLVSVAVPSLNVSRDLSKQMGCRANLHSLSKSMLLYCQDNQDRWPPYRMRVAGGQPKVDPYTDAEHMMWGAKVGDIDFPTLKQKYRGVGIMYNAGYVEDPSKFYCPAATFDWFVYENYIVDRNGRARPWGTYAPWSTLVRTGYLFQMWGKYYDQENTWDIAFRTLSSMETDKAMAMDHALFFWASGVHTNQGGRQTIHNVLHVTGHVDAYANTGALDALKVFAETGTDSFAWADWPGPLSDWEEVYTLLQSEQ